VLASSLWGVVVAALGGAAIGVERERSGHASGANAHLGGVRTFTLLGGLAGMAGWLATLGLAALAVVLVAAAAALVVVGYASASRRDIDATTEVAALVAIAAGILAGSGRLALASGIVAIAVLLLVEKTRLHSAVARLDDEEMRAAARFGVMAVVILPLLPEGPFGPLGGVRPRQLWILVLFFTGLSFAGYIARRAVGAKRGYPLAGVLGGLVSSTNVTYTFARLSRRAPADGAPLAIGAVGACLMLFPRVLLASALLNADVAAALWPYVLAPSAIGGAAMVSGLRGATAAPEPPAPANPLQLWPAVQMTIVFQVVLYGVFVMREWFGGAGLLASGAVLGLTDLDALTLSMARMATEGTAATLAARAIVAGIIANSVVKLVIALALGSATFKRPAAAMMAAMLASLVVMWLVIP
jgi:uncharacterized membrane protein (DUF4010 family)